jgi:molybdate transport system substrate-binding protein
MRSRVLMAAFLAAGVAATLGLGFVRTGRAGETKELVVFAATSLREVFQKLAESFEKTHTGVKVRLNFAGSQELRVQIEHGAKADVFASADTKHMQAVEDQGLAAQSRVFARNEPVVIVPAANPAKISRFAELPRAERIVTGVAEVPIGAYTEVVLANAEKTYGKRFRDTVLAHIRSRELNVRQVLTKVALGEADAGIVYKTDALSAKEKVSAIAIPDSINVVADYPIAVLSAARRPDLARRWVDTVLGDEAQRALMAAGFHPGSGGASGAAKR